jgi:prepilin-type N-terminal cleavage/methylation domain-containing protein
MRITRESSSRLRSTNGGERGFTLIEVLLTLLIMSGIMLTMTSILTAARTSRDTIHNIQETQLAGPAILDRIERDLRALTVYDRTRQLQLRIKNKVNLGFDADGLDFVCTTRSLTLHEEEDRFVRASANEVGYRLRIAPTGDFLELYRREEYGVDDDPFEGGNYLLLHERVRGFDIRCFEKDGPDEEPIDEWGATKNDEHIGLPARVEITLTIELAPRLVNEQLRIVPTDKLIVVYKRVIRFPEGVRLAEEDIPVPRIPKPESATAANNAGGAATGGGQGGTDLLGGGNGRRGGKPPPVFGGAGQSGGGTSSGGGQQGGGAPPGQAPPPP